VEEVAPPPPVAPLGPIERRVFDYGDLDAAMVAIDETIRHARRVLEGRGLGVASGIPGTLGDGWSEDASGL
jgi:hypothetical protein